MGGGGASWRGVFRGHQSLLPGFPCTQTKHAPGMPWHPHRKETHLDTSFQEPNQPRAEGAGWDTRAAEASVSLPWARSRELLHRQHTFLGPPADAKFPVLRDADTALAVDPSAQKEPTCRASRRSQLACVTAALRSQKHSPLTPCALSAARPQGRASSSGLPLTAWEHSQLSTPSEGPTTCPNETGALLGLPATQAPARHQQGRPAPAAPKGASGLLSRRNTWVWAPLLHTQI